MKKMTTVLLGLSIILILSNQALANKDLQNDSWHTFHGFVEKMPVGLHGTWIINGRSVQVTPYSRVEQNAGFGTVGSYAEVRGKIRGQSLLATTIQIEPGGKFLIFESPDHKHENGRFHGKIENIPKEKIGYWEIDGHQVLVDRLSQVVEAHGQTVVGAVVSVIGYYRNNTFYANRVEAF